jgi:hypothetical protein
MFGTMSVRRRFVNITGQPITRLRFRVIDVSTFPLPPGLIADVRPITSVTVSGVTVNDAATCAPAAPPCPVTVQGTTLELPTQVNGGGLNSALAAGTITIGTPLAAGASVNLQFLMGVQKAGTFKFFITVEALP